MKNLLYLVVILFVISCKSESNHYFGEPKNNKKDIQLTNLSVEKIELDTAANFSFLEGRAGTINGNYYYFDYVFGWLYQFDTDGHLVSTKLGNGRSNAEVFDEPIMHTFLNDGKLFYFGGTGYCCTYNKDFYREDMFMLSYNGRETATMDSAKTYSPGVNRILRSYKDKVYIGTYINQSAKYGFFTNADLFLKEYRWLSEISLTEKNRTQMFGKGFPDVYMNNKYEVVNFMNGVNFDIDKKGNFYVNFEADSLIYKYDNDFKFIASYGWDGRDLDKSYTTLKSQRDLKRAYKSYYDTDRVKKGYYTWVEYIDELGYTCRSYQKGGESMTDGLQIYSGTTLIADIDVPKGFKPMGYAKPYLFSDAINENDERMVTYRIKLE